MSCKFSYPDGRCAVWGDGIEIQGCNEYGFCVCEDDENPGYSCEDYEER